MNKTKAWYIRGENIEGIKGPFPGGQITQEILLGRYVAADEVSHDKEEWISIRNLPELFPEIYKGDKNDPLYKERLAAARRWADERRGVSRVDGTNERRHIESYEDEEIKRLHRLANSAKKKTNPLVIFSQVTFILAALIIVVVLAFQYSPKDKSTADCTAVAKQGVNWSHCNLSGAKLSKTELIAANLMSTNLQTANLFDANLTLANLKYAELHLANLQYVNFTKANLKGANLLGADISGAIFDQADLSYANLRDVKMLETNFKNARLDNAIWVDGRTCGLNSIGVCKY